MSLADRLVEEARAVHLGTRESVALSRTDLAQIASDPGFQLRLRQKLRTVNDPDLRTLILNYLTAAAHAFDVSAKQTDSSVETLEWTLGFGSKILPLAGGAIAVAGIITGVGVLGGAALLAGGILGLALAGGLRHNLKQTALRDRAGSETILRLVASLRDELT